MSTIGVIATTIVIAIFVFALLSCAGVLIWITIVARRELQSVRSFFQSFADDLNESTTNHREAMIRLLESASTSHQLLSDEIRTTLESHRLRTDAQIQEINGKQIAEAVQAFLESNKQFQSTAKRNEMACLAFSELVKRLDRGVQDGDIDSSGLGPEDYAPNPDGIRWAGIGPVSAGDEEALSEESLDNQSQFPG